MQQGLRQGDPIYPLLFNLVGEMLSQFLIKAKSLGIFHGLSLNSNFEISHLQFADDTVLFLEANTKSVRGIKVILKLFELASGLKINFDKSSILKFKP